MYDEIIDSLTQSYRKGIVEISSVWDQENIRWQYIESLNDYYDSKNGALKNLNLYCSNVKDLDFASELPSETTVLFNFNPQDKLLELQKKDLQAYYVEEKQNNACTISFGGTISKNTEPVAFLSLFDELKKIDSFSWSLTLSADISNLFSGKNKELKKEYKENNRVYEIKQKNIQEEKKQSLLFYDYSIKICTEQLLNAEKMRDDRFQFYNDMQTSYLQGDCTKIDVLEAESEYFSAKCILDNIKDTLWFYKWAKNQIK
ncbi:MAG: hypothetical protein BKP49_05515 [Treponema sp. CETP13]|nr:MAG: hypothetical protein BKP49_05515 [Treponema sp. CETP13]